MEKGSLKRFSGILQFHENPTVISLWIRIVGPILSWATPSRRRTLLAIGAGAMAARFVLGEGKPSLPGGLVKINGFEERLILVAMVLFLFLLCHNIAKRFSDLPLFVKRRPQVFLHGLFWLMVLGVWMSAPQDGFGEIVLALFVAILPFFLWRLGYMFISAQRGRVKGTPLKDHLLYLWPLYGGSNTPYAKGLDYLSRVEAKDIEGLARSQLAGIRLLILGGLWIGCKSLVDGIVFGVENWTHNFLGWAPTVIPRLRDVVSQPHTASWGIGWVSVYLDLFYSVLNRAAKGHLIIGTVRLFGFYAFRNTYKPLLAETVVGFWNRYYYYFKELLVEFFFYPTFARWFKKRPALRLFAAVFMAAFVGNMYYHLISISDRLVVKDLEALWASLGSRFVYCLGLSIGIFVSMLREQRRVGSPNPKSMGRRCLSIFGVWSFFALINIWNQKGAADLQTSTRFFLMLLGFQ